MGLQSIVSGYIKVIGPKSTIEQNKSTISTSEKWPYGDIFWCDSPAVYSGGAIAFAGSYKQIEEVWSEWLWHFSQLLQELEAVDAHVLLDCVMGIYTWRLMPKPYYDQKTWLKEQSANSESRIALPSLPASMVGQPWGIVEAPDDDFSIDPEWLKRTENNLATFDEATNTLMPYKWDLFVERWPNLNNLV